MSACSDEPMRLTRRQFFRSLGATACVAGGGYGYARLIEPDWLDVSRVTVPMLAQGSAPVTVLHLSDFHADDEHALARVEQTVLRVLGERFDFTVITGDFITRRIFMEDRMRAVLALIAKRRPTFAVFGNHDGGRWAARRRGYDSTEPVGKLLESSGVRALKNENAGITIGRTSLTVVGTGDLWGKEVVADRAWDGAPSKEPIIALTHNPDTKGLLKTYPWDLLLAGHTHGGQFVVPVIEYAPFLPIVDAKYRAGLCDYEGRPVYVNRGIGSLHGLRFNCRPEAALIELVAKDAGG